jgi:hypothetical protein
MGTVSVGDIEGSGKDCFELMDISKKGQYQSYNFLVVIDGKPYFRKGNQSGPIHHCYPDEHENGEFTFYLIHNDRARLVDYNQMNRENQDMIDDQNITEQAMHYLEELSCDPLY